MIVLKILLIIYAVSVAWVAGCIITHELNRRDDNDSD
jgi:hypothetical protein